MHSGSMPTGMNWFYVIIIGFKTIIDMPIKPDLAKDQAFMVDPKALKWIVKQAGLTKDDTVLEIGAGSGNLTRLLAASGARVVAIELDRSLEPELRKNLRGSRKVKIILGNGLKVLDSRSIKFTKIVSNIPYAISEPLIQKLIFHDFDIAVMTLPKKFAHRLIAANWEKDYSMLSFMFQRFYIVQACLDLQKNVFTPTPKTNSVILKFESKPKNSVFCQLFLKPNMITKNALREALCKAKGYTKNHARQTINSLDLNTLMDRKVRELSVHDIKDIVSRAAMFRDI